MQFASDLGVGLPAALVIVMRAVVVYVVVLIGVRLTGKREVGQMTPFDLVLILLIANAVQNAMVGSDTSLAGGLVAALALFGVNWLVGRVADRDRRVRRWLIGSPRVLVSSGEVLKDNMRREDINEDELLAAIREHGVAEIADVQLAVLEIDGTISVVPKDANVFHSKRQVRQLKHGE